MSTENRIILCPGFDVEKKERCGSELSVSQSIKFCPACGWRIDKKIWNEGSIACDGKFADGSECTNVLDRGEETCLKCQKPKAEIKSSATHGATYEEVGDVDQQNPDDKNCSISKESEEELFVDIDDKDLQGLSNLPTEEHVLEGSPELQQPVVVRFRAVASPKLIEKQQSVFLKVCDLKPSGKNTEGFPAKLERIQQSRSGKQRIECTVLIPGSKLRQYVAFHYKDAAGNLRKERIRHRQEKRCCTFLTGQTTYYCGFVNVDASFLPTVVDNEIKNSVTKLFPYLEFKSVSPTKEFLREVSFLKTGLYETYIQQGVLPDEVTHYFKKGMATVLNKKIWKDDTNTRYGFLQGVFVVYCASVYQIELSEDVKIKICQLLVLDCEQGESKNYVMLKENFEEYSGDILIALIEFIINWKKAEEPMWLCCLPLYHLLSGKCVSMKKQKHTHAMTATEIFSLASNDTVEKLAEKLEKLESVQKWNRTPFEMLEILQTMFDVDPLLPWSFAASLSLERMDSLMTDIRSSKNDNKMPLEVIIGYYARKLNSSGMKTRGFTTFRNKAKPKFYSGLKSLECLIKNNKEGFQQQAGNDILHSLILGTNFAEESLHLVMVSCTDTPVPILRVFCILVQFVDATEMLAKSMESSEIDAEDLHSRERLLRVLDVLFSWFIVYMKAEKSAVTILQQLENIIDKEKDILNEDVRTTYREGVQQKMDLVFRWLEKNAEDLLDIYIGNLFDVDIQTSLREKVLEAVDKNIDLMVDKDRKWMQTAEHTKNYTDIFSKLLDRYWPEPNDRDVRLKFALTWNHFRKYIQLYHKKNLSLEERRIQQCISDITQTKSLIQFGNIKIDEFMLVYKYKRQFIEILNCLTDGLNESIFECRRLEVQTIEKIKRRIVILEKLCHPFDVALLEIHAWQQKARSKDSKIIDICNPCTEQVIENQQEQISYFLTLKLKVLPPFLDMLHRIESRCDEFLFKKIWTSVGKEESMRRQSEENMKAISEEDIVQSVFDPTISKWEETRQKIIQGKISFAEILDLFDELEENEMAEEFVHFKTHSTQAESTLLDKRLNQILSFQAIEDCVVGAELIIQYVETFNVRGDFDAIRKISSMEKNKDMLLEEFDVSFLLTCGVLKGITISQWHCLEEFNNCKDLIDWITENIKSIGHLKVFVELAGLAAGEGDMEETKSCTLHDALFGYAPLIFDIDENCDYKIFLERFQILAQTLENDPKLPDKLRDTSRLLEWLKNINQTHGSLQKTSLRQIDAINTTGVYTIDLTQGEDGNLRLTTDDTLQLHFFEGDGKEKMRRKFTYSDAQDLKSKIMLIAGSQDRKKTDIDYFLTVFDSIERLADVFNELLSSGCTLFADLNAEFRCDKDGKECATLSFGGKSDSIEVKSYNDGTSDFSRSISILASFFETCSEEWTEHIEHIRQRYTELNFFTIEQIVILQRQLVRLDNDNYEVAMPILSRVKNGCTRSDLITAIKSVGDRLERDVNDSKEEKSFSKSDVAKVSPEMETFLKGVMLAGFSRELALNAYESIQNQDDITEGIEWCQDHEDLMESKTEESKDSEEEYKSWKSANVLGEKMMLSIKESIKRSNMAKKTELRDIWTEFLSTVCGRNVSDFLSVEHLGMILQELAIADDQCAKRSFQWFNEGEPNLLLCDKESSIKTFLSVYCNDEEQELPSVDEVLLCHRNTRLDEIDIFWRRSILKASGKIYCILNAENLDHDTSEKATKKLQEYLKRASEEKIDFRMVAICCSELDSNSRLVAALLKYQRPNLPIHTRHQSYIKKKMIVQNSTAVTSSVVDKERCCIRVVKSTRAGMGKSLFKKRMSELLSEETKLMERSKPLILSIPFHEKSIDLDSVMSVLRRHILPPEKNEPRIFHFDFSNENLGGIDDFMIQLLILGSIRDSLGYVWNRSPVDMYIIEITTSEAEEKNHGIPSCLNLFPSITCLSPTECLKRIESQEKTDAQMFDFDDKEFLSEAFQKTYNYLKTIHGVERKHSKKDCLDILLRFCGLPDPSWAELRHFVMFLYTQILDMEQSTFCQPVALESLPGFKPFVLNCILQMSKDFSTRSLNISDESNDTTVKKVAGNQSLPKELEYFQLKRTWESSNHPYLFFNPDHNTMTFLGFTIDGNGNLVDKQRDKVIKKSVMSRELFFSLQHNNVNLTESVDELSREQNIAKLCTVMGISLHHDPDETYKLTSDNVKKMLAIYMRFRCGIPVILMGETGCGKTRLIKFLCGLQNTDKHSTQSLVIMKVHGGTTKDDIKEKVKKAEEIAEKSIQKNKNSFTVLFFDEANTTDAIGMIKEIMCDGTMDGEEVKLTNNLKFVAAVNPYRVHSEAFIKKLERAGLGYNVDSERTEEKFGTIPLRRLVYRVHPLPGSMLPLVWDFGNLRSDVEELYINQIVSGYMKEKNFPDVDGLLPVISSILSGSQKFMRSQQNECSFVSLRNVERSLEVMNWFYTQKTEKNGIFSNGEEEISSDFCDSTEVRENKGFLTTFRTFFKVTERKIEQTTPRNPEIQLSLRALTESLVLALGVCYHASLVDRKKYRDFISEYFQYPLSLSEGGEEIRMIIENCQTVLLESIKPTEDIAKNQALKENVFMMIICIELRIPLFLVGKPGSSKSLAKTVVADAMQGNSSSSDMFRKLKQIQMVSFQCSPISDHTGILSVFKECARYQKDKNLAEFVAVVVLDEVGLAEDSPKMPLKALHPLLEDGDLCEDNGEMHKKVGFIGLSNWALDPAKMNRGIFVQREVPDLEELKNTAKDICSVSQNMCHLIEPLAESYLEVFNSSNREFFGLRDFYSMIKMVRGFARKGQPSWSMLQHAIKRNFGGFEEINAEEIFNKRLEQIKGIDKTQILPDDPDCSSIGLIEAVLNDKTNSRYLLLMTESYGALEILKQKFETLRESVTIFGSSFPSDRKYTQICRNINRIKVCMETGKTVVLLNLENLYESLYDALNQYYVYFGAERFVDLGLGIHRLKCKVHKDFRLIVIAETDTVHNKFPIPLINRLEKHVLKISALLTPSQLEFAEDINNWTKKFVSLPKTQRFRNPMNEFKREEVFLGFHKDVCSSIVLHLYEQNDSICKNVDTQQITKKMRVHDMTATVLYERDINSFPVQSDDQNMNDVNPTEPSRFETIDEDAKENEYPQAIAGNENANLQPNTQEMFILGKRMLLKCVPPDSILRLRTTSLSSEAHEIHKMYFEQQSLESLNDFLKAKLHAYEDRLLLYQVTTHSKLLSTIEVKDLCKTLSLSENDVKILNLVSFETEHQFNKNVGYHLTKQATGRSKLLIVQCDRGNENGDLIACARYSILDTILDVGLDKLRNTVVMLIVQISRLSRRQFAGFQCTQWESLHIDDLRMPEKNMPTMAEMASQSISSLLENSVQNESNEQRHLDMKFFIKICASSAFARIRDPKQDLERSAQRINLFYKLLHGTEKHEEESFFNGIGLNLSNLMKEKENRSNITRTESTWLSGEATNRVVVNKAGTFRKACRQCMVEKISPLLAGLIAYIDQNRNIDTLFSNSQWKKKLWHKILSNVNATNIQYSLFLSPNNKEVVEYFVKGTAASEITFHCKLPFSWIFFNCIQSGLKACHSVADSDDRGKVERVEKIVEEKEAFHILREYPEDENDIVLDYMNDFLYMIHPFSSILEHEILKGRFQKEYLQLQLPEPSTIGKMVSMHLLYKKFAPQFLDFSHIVRVWPDCVLKISEMQKETNESQQTQELEVDKQGLNLLMKNVIDSTKELKSASENLKKEWLVKMVEIRPAVEKIIQDCNSIEYETIKDTIYWWNCIKTMKLLIENACFVDDIINGRCMSLWASIVSTNEAQQSLSKLLENTERFLTRCKKDVITKLLEVKNCEGCDSPLSELPIVLPCNHFVCVRCFEDTNLLKKLECRVCKKPFAEEFIAKKIELDDLKMKRYNAFVKCVNTFFMAFISDVCLARKSKPSCDLVESLLRHIVEDGKTQGIKINKTKEFSMFETGIDPTPVMRSFLLQHLISACESDVKGYLKEYLSNTGLIEMKDDTKLSMLLISCFEDNYYREAVGREQEIALANTKLIGHLQHTAIELNYVDLIEYLAETRYGLVVAAKYLHETLFENREPIDQNVRNLLQSAFNVCQNFESNVASYFIVKVLCRTFGVQCYNDLVHSKFTDIQRFVLPEFQMKMLTECPDRFIVCGDAYMEIRDAVLKCARTGNCEELQQIVNNKERSTAETMVRYVYLAVVREITLKNIYPESEKEKFRTKELQDFLEVLRKRRFPKEDIVCNILNNNAWVKESVLNIQEEIDLHTQSTVSFIYHFLIAIIPFGGVEDILAPLANLIWSPEKMKKAFLPGMPDDGFSELVEAFGHSAPFSEMFGAIYRCPNGHVYIVGDCGRPTVTSKCRDCGAEIGGRSHKPVAGNVRYDCNEGILQGHTLGEADPCHIVPARARSLSAIECSITRLFVHVSMYISCSLSQENLQKIKGIIKMQLEKKRILPFLWAHIQVDLSTLQNALKRNVEETFLCLHKICNDFMERPKRFEVERILTRFEMLRRRDALMRMFGNLDTRRQQREFDFFMRNRQSRRAWEDAFSSSFLRPTLKDLSKSLGELNQKLVKDKRIGSDKFQRMLFEMDDTNAEENKNRSAMPKPLHETSDVWIYRSQITICDFYQELLGNTQKESNKILRLFLDEEQSLKAIRFVPSIQKLQRLLIREYQRKILRSDASVMKIKQVIEEFSSRGEENTDIRPLVKDFKEAWECVRTDLQTFLCPTRDGAKTVPSALCQSSINDDTPLTVFLPNHHGNGLCSFALLFYLVQKQNNFLESCCVENRERFSSRSTVALNNILESHLISFDHDRDFLPMLHTNCTYMFKAETGTKMDYNVNDLERQIMDRFLAYKPIIAVSFDELDLMTYRYEGTNATVFTELRQKIPQECLKFETVGRICVEFQDYTELCDALDKLDIAICFLKSVGEHPETRIGKFLSETLKMEKENPFENKSIRCKHIQSLWIILSFEKTKKQLLQSQEHVFQHVREEMKQEINDAGKKLVIDLCTSLSKDQLEIILWIVFECIELLLLKQKDIDDVSDNDIDIRNISFKDNLIGFIDATPYSEAPRYPNWVPELISKFPQEVMSDQAISLWIRLYTRSRQLI